MTVAGLALAESDLLLDSGAAADDTAAAGDAAVTVAGGVAGGRAPSLAGRSGQPPSAKGTAATSVIRVRETMDMGYRRRLLHAEMPDP